MRLPKQRIMFAVDLMPVSTLPGRAMVDSYPIEWEEGLRKSAREDGQDDFISVNQHPVVSMRPICPIHALESCSSC
jgi:hypothetical protein